ncbi:MAG: hypothetical protein PHV17_03555 [Candidatus Omnitrophica bacterium]|nr:hypothetical protein [Candidatus Omnitrophota bacterium]
MTILNAIKRKTLLLNKTYFKPQEVNVLFIEDDSPVDFVKHEDKGIEILKKKYNPTFFSEQYCFNIVHIFSNCTFIYDIFGECIKTCLRKKELPNI